MKKILKITSSDALLHLVSWTPPSKGEFTNVNFLEKTLMWEGTQKQWVDFFVVAEYDVIEVKEA